MRVRHDQAAQWQWFVLRCMTGHEARLGRWLMRDGYATFVPIETRYRYANWQAKQRGCKRPVKYPLLPGYLFIGLNASTPSWAPVWRYTGVIGVIGEARPMPVMVDQLGDLMKRHARGRFTAPASHRYMQTGREFRPGDDVVTMDGCIEGKVETIRGSTSYILVTMLGRDALVKARTADLVAA